MRRIRKQCDRCLRHQVQFNDSAWRDVFGKYLTKSESFVCNMCLIKDDNYLRDHPEV